MYEPHIDRNLDPNAFSPLLRALSAVLAIAIAGALALEVVATVTAA
jgi:hypothetical protein